ncbi:MAG TPA: hypothetical protein VIF11_00875 [Methylomirabilota bacterium]|jgi:uncharacterized BrkB/YihY/UPF0761 family membrane protein
MSRRRNARKLIWAALAVQFAGLIADLVWHALHSDFEARTVEQMLVHLGTVHIPIYVGVVCVLLATSWALIDQARRPPIGAAFPVAFVGALVSTIGEAWHAYMHLQLDTHSAPFAGIVSFVGFLIVVVAMWVSGRGDRRRKPADVAQRRAA